MAEAEPVEETRTLTIRQVVLTSADIIELAKMVGDAIRASPHFEERDRSSDPVKVEVHAMDGSSQSGTTTGIIGSKILEHHTVKSIDITAISGSFIIGIDLSHGDNFHRASGVRVVGTDPTWVNGTMRRIEEFLGRLEPQWKWSRRTRWMLIAFSELAIAAAAISVGLFIYSLTPERAPTADSPWTDALLFITGAMVGLAGVASGWMFGAVAADYIGSLWPTVELRTGREHMSVEDRKRKRLVLMTSLIVVPFLVSFVASIAAAIAMD